MKIGNSDSDCVLGTLLVLWLVPYLHPMQFWVAGGQKVSTNCSFVWVVDAMVEQCKLLHVQVSLLGHGPQCGVLCFVSSICQRQLLSLWKVDETKWSRSERVTRSLMLRVRRKVPEGSLRLWTRIFSVALWICAVKTTRSLHLKWDFWSLLFAFRMCVLFFEFTTSYVHSPTPIKDQRHPHHNVLPEQSHCILLSVGAIV